MHTGSLNLWLPVCMSDAMLAEPRDPTNPSQKGPCNERVTGYSAILTPPDGQPCEPHRRSRQRDGP